MTDFEVRTDINPECDVCNGTGIDADFGGKCTMCWGTVSRAFDPALVGAQESGFERFRGNNNQASRANNMQAVQPPSDKQIAFLRSLGHEGEIPSNRKMVSVLIDKLVGERDAPNAPVAAPAAAKPAQARWAKVDGQWMIRVTGMVVYEGQTIKVTKANGEIKDVTLGVQFDAELWNAGRPANKPAAKPATVDVPEGRYAVQGIDGERGDILFVKVDRPTEGKWAGYTFIKQIVGGHPEYAIRGTRASDVLARIAEAGIKESAMLYGQQIGQCARCHAHLTSEWRKVGIGPECSNKY